MVADDGESPTSSTSGLRSSAQPSGIVLDNEAILSYYQSAAADGAMSGASLVGHSPGTSSYTLFSSTELHSRSNSSTSTATQFSTSSSAYSCDSSKSASTAPSAYKNPHPRTVLPPGLSGATRRSSIPSEGGADRRRMAIVDMGTDDRGRPCGGTGENPSNNTTTTGSSSSSNLRSRRGIEAQLGGLALVAPPDASPRSYTNFTPPLTAPIQPPSMQLQSSIAPSHVRSMSEAVGGPGRNTDTGHVRKSSREVAVVGTTERPTNPSDVQTTSSPVTEALKPPIFQIPQSRSPSPGTPETSDSGSSTAPRSRRRKDALFPGISPIKELKETLSPAASPGPAAVVTPRIGESKNISDRVAGPVIINIFPDSPSPVSLAKPSTRLSSKTDMTSPLLPVTTPYLFYQPGLHAKAGPLPSPPIAVFSIDPRAPPPPRPPRHSPLKNKGDMEAVKQALSLPPSVTAALNARTPLREHQEESRAITSNISPSSEVEKEIGPTLSTNSMGSNPSRPVVYPQLEAPNSKYNATDWTKKEAELPQTPAHAREGAFPPSRVCTTDSNDSAFPEQMDIPLPRHESMDDLVASVGHAIDDMGIMRSSDVPPPTVLEPLRHNENRGKRPGLDIRRFSSTPTPPLESAESEKGPDVLPPLPAKNERQSLDLRVRSALSIKRFSSLPRPPSPMSLNRLSTESKKSFGTPSPSLVDHPGTKALPPVERVRSACPPAMHFADVIVKKSALDRSLGYAQKINELYTYDSGLGDWVVETRYKAANPQKSGKRATVSPGTRVPTTHSPRSQTRNISESSTGSEVTFPRRPDAYLATDLSTPPSGDSSPPNAPPPLPYPALAAAPRNGSNRASTMMTSSSSSSGRSLTSPASSSKSPAGFFASLGRKTSLKKDKLVGSTVPVIGRVLSRSPPRSEPTPRPVIISSAPSVPGGPRAPPHRMQRSQTIVVSQSSSNGSAPHRSSTVVQRPSQLGRNTFSDRGSPIDPDEFARQVDKLAALLPKANRTVLEGYLRRAGQDILAIGQYLEDEKNGTLCYD